MYHIDTYLTNHIDTLLRVSIRYNLQMDKRSQLRRINMLALLKHSGLNNKEFAQRIGVAATYFGQVKKGHENGGRNIGNSLAPEIEKAFKKPSGWLDQDHTKPIKQKQAESEVMDLTDNQKLILKHFDNMSEGDKDSLIIALMAIAAGKTQR